jgi:hypothetical protein
MAAELVVPCHFEMFELNTASPDEFMLECILRHYALPHPSGESDLGAGPLRSIYVNNMLLHQGSENLRLMHYDPAIAMSRESSSSSNGGMTQI